MLVFVLHFSYLTLFTIRQAGWGPKDVCNNEGNVPAFGAGLLTPQKRPTEGLPVNERPSVGGVARSETGHNKVGSVGQRNKFRSTELAGCPL